MKDMTDPKVQAEYESKIYDGARDLAVRFKGRPLDMRQELLIMGGAGAEVNAVVDAMNDPEYEETMYRGAMVDEGVIEALKDVLRPLNGF